jgi:hypothetical protein
MTKVRTVDLADVEPGSPSAACLRQQPPDARISGKLVERVGVVNETVTLRDSLGLHSCDNSPGMREGNRRWCGGATGVFFDGRLDPRLNILCETDDGKPMGFAWIQPSPNARYISLGQAEYNEVYEVAGGLPVRVATVSGVQYERFKATFDISEHDGDGRLLREYELEAYVAG